MKSLIASTPVIFTCFFLQAVGCRRVGPPTIDVVGVVQVDGVPIEGALVYFHPVDPSGTAASGLTDVSGRYDLTTVVRGDGALAGEYRVGISKFEQETLFEGSGDGEDDVEIDRMYDELDKRDGKEAESKSLIALRYLKPETSELRVEVKANEGQNEFPFEVSAK